MKWRVIGQHGAIEWSTCSPDLTPVDFYFWSVVKDKVLTRRPHNLQELEAYIYDTFQDIENDSTVQKCDLEECTFHLDDCINSDGAQFEHLRQTLSNLR